LCALINDNDIAQARDLPEEVWAFIKKHKFLGMVIAKEHGGLGFGASAHAAVITKIATTSSTAAVSVMVPNSLGPGELLYHYGTEDQKKYYLPRLAEGLEIPCFALTEPHAGSDAANGRSVGSVCKGMHEGKEVLGIKLDFNKRYITLAPIASVIGLAFRLYDPDKLLGDTEDIGITCALLPRDTKGMEIGERHDPMGVPFNNGPIRGKGVFIPMDYVIGGQACVGSGWRMLMECLAIGRSVSLPSLSVGGSQFATLSMSAYTAIREQFGLPIGKFEGVREPLARIFASSYWMSATRNITCGAIDSGEKPSVASAIVKSYLTEGMRLAINDAMDVQAGAAICRGPRNLFSRLYSSIPIGITVEGANILTRSLIVFGQGAMRCHPFLLKEIKAISDDDLKTFDKAFFAHINHVVKNAVRALVHALSFASFAAVPAKGKESRHYRRISRLSAAFAFAADMGLLSLGGELKRKEYLSGRFADALAWLYIASMTLKRSHDENAKEDWPLVDYSLSKAEYEIENALFGVITNLPNRLAAWIIRIIAFPFGRSYFQPTDKQLDSVVDAVMNSKSDLRERLTSDVFIPNADIPGLGALNNTYKEFNKTLDVRQKLSTAVREGKIEKGIPINMAKQAQQIGLISEGEYSALIATEHARDDIIQVDYFDPEVYKQLR
jgi:acyl-CoA dehydrogenase